MSGTKGGKRGRGGRKALPATVKALKGTLRKIRMNADAPAPDEKTATAQPAIERHQGAVEAFTALQAIVADMGNDSATFAHALSLTALLWSDMENLQAAVDAEGWTLESETARGLIEIRANPKVKMLRDVQKELRLWIVEFGLTPSAIQRVGQMKKQSKNSFDLFIR